VSREHAFEAILRDHGLMLGRIAASYEANPAKRQELQQDILAAVWRSLPGFRGEASIRTFLARIAHNRSISHVARAAAEPRMAELDDAMPCGHPSPFDEIERNDQQRRLMNAVRTLPLSAREPVVLTLEGFTPREIAAMLDVTPNSVSIRLTRAKEMLRAALGT
jgi:RNA polymerase sigma factor (sigma-70 family)